MTGFLFHSPAEVIHQALLDLSLANEPSYGYDWPAFVDHLPEEDDDSICVYNTEGTIQGRIQHDGEPVEFHGIQVAVRSAGKANGRLKAHRIARALDTQVRRTEVTVGSVLYLIQSFNRTTEVVSAGFDKDTRRHLHTINGTLSVIQTGTGSSS